MIGVDQTYFITYCNTIEFTPISTRNISDYIILKQDEDFLYVVHPLHTVGFVFDMTDVRKNEQTMIPVMRVSLENKQIQLCKIQTTYRETNLSATWITLYNATNYDH